MLMAGDACVGFGVSAAELMASYILVLCLPGSVIWEC